MKRRLLVTMLVVGVIATALVGCGKTDKGNTTAKNEVSTSTESEKAVEDTEKEDATVTSGKLGDIDREDGETKETTSALHISNDAIVTTLNNTDGTKDESTGKWVFDEANDGYTIKDGNKIYIRQGVDNPTYYELESPFEMPTVPFDYKGITMLDFIDSATGNEFLVSMNYAKDSSGRAPEMVLQEDYWTNTWSSSGDYVHKNGSYFETITTDTFDTVYVEFEKEQKRHGIRATYANNDSYITYDIYDEANSLNANDIELFKKVIKSVKVIKDEKSINELNQLATNKLGETWE